MPAGHTLVVDHPEVPMYAVLVLAHAVAGALALGAGISVLLRPPRWLGTYLAALVAMMVLLVAAMGARWATYDATTRLVFGVLVLFGLVVVEQGWRAYRLRPAPGERPGRDHQDSLGFTLVALTDAFLVIAVLDLGGPTWAGVATGVGAAVAGHLLLRRVQDAGQRLSAPAPR